MNERKIYFHVGLGRAASTYLQKNVFPCFQGVHYVERNKFKRHGSIVPTLTAERILLSRESSKRLQSEISKLVTYYPDAIPIVVLRRHDQWIASQYRRYVKNGGAESFSGFIDLEHDQGVWNKCDLVLRDKLDLLEQTFNCKPFVMFHERLCEAPFEMIDEMAALLGATYDRQAIRLAARHQSYSDKQLQVLRRYRPRLLEAHPDQSKVGFLRVLRFRARLLAAYSIMALARFFPDDGFAGQPLIPEASLEQIRQMYAYDWDACQAYARLHNSQHL